MPEGIRPATVGVWWLSRALCRTRSFDLSAVPAAERRAALANLVRAWAPFDRSDYRVVLVGARGLAWAWDSVRVRDMLTDAGASPKAQPVPECLHRARLAADGMRLVATLEGYEGQQWADGVPVRSRWWPQLPGLADWRTFAADGDALPPVDAAGWLSRPSFDAQPIDNVGNAWPRAERLAAGAAACALVSLSAAQAHQAWTLHQQAGQVVSELSRLAGESAPVLAARDRALALMSEADVLSRGLQGVQPLDVLRHLADVLPGKGVQLKEFDLGGTALRLGLQISPEVQRSAVVRDLQAGGWLVDVTEARDAPGRSWVSLDMKLNAVNLPVLPRASTAASSPSSGAPALSSSPAPKGVR